MEDIQVAQSACPMSGQGRPPCCLLCSELLALSVFKVAHCLIQGGLHVVKWPACRVVSGSLLRGSAVMFSAQQSNRGKGSSLKQVIIPFLQNVYNRIWRPMARHQWKKVDSQKDAVAMSRCPEWKKRESNWLLALPRILLCLRFRVIFTHTHNLSDLQLPLVRRIEYNSQINAF